MPLKHMRRKNSVEFDIMCNLFFLEIKPKSKRDKLTWRAKRVMQLKSSALKSPQKRPKKVQKQRRSKFTKENSSPSKKNSQKF